MTFSFTRMLLGGALLALSATNANATILNTTGQDLFALGNVVIGSFLHENAGDTSKLYVSVNGGPDQFLFQNNIGTLSGTPTIFLTSPGNSLVFTLKDLSVPNNFSTGATSTNVSYVIFDGSIANLNAALFSGGESLSFGASFVMTLLGAGTYVLAYEDRPLASADKDYNDLIFAFRPVRGCVAGQPCATPTDGDPVPEPGVLGLLAIGLLSLFGLQFGKRRRLS